MAHKKIITKLQLGIQKQQEQLQIQKLNEQWRYSSLTQSKIKQQPQLCRYWKQSKCNREGCEFVHYELKHLNTTFNLNMKEGARVINENYQKNIEEGKALVQITSLQFLDLEQIERIMKKTDSYKQEIQIAVINKTAFKKFKKEYRNQMKNLDDDSYNNKIQLKIYVFKQSLDHIIKIDKKKPQLNTQQHNNTQSEKENTLNNTQQTQMINQQMREMEIELINQQSLIQQKYKQETSLKRNNENLDEEPSQNKNSNKKRSISKQKQTETKPTPKPILKKQSSDKTTKREEKEKKQKTQQPSDITPQRNKMILKISAQKNVFSKEEFNRSNFQSGNINQIHIDKMNKIALETQKNSGQLPKNVVQRMFPTIMSPNSLYPNYILALITNQETIRDSIIDKMNINQEITKKVQCSVLLDSVYLYYLKLSSNFIAIEDNKKEETYLSHLNNITILLIGKIKNTMQMLNIPVGQTTNTALMEIIDKAFSDEEKKIYIPKYLINIGTEEQQILITLEIADAAEIQKTQEEKKGQKSKK